MKDNSDEQTRVTVRCQGGAWTVEITGRRALPAKSEAEAFAYANGFSDGWRACNSAAPQIRLPDFINEGGESCTAR